MSATILLIRHATHGHVGSILSGRMSDIPLTDAGRGEAEALARMLAGEAIDRIEASPVQRAQETALAIAHAQRVAVEGVPALDEIDFGQWTGRSFDALAGDPAWDRWNNQRASAAPPGGESMAAAQARAVAHIRTTAAAVPGRIIAMVTHCDIIRAVVAHAIGLSLNDMLRFDVDPASVTRIAAGDWGMRLVSLNQRILR